MPRYMLGPAKRKERMLNKIRDIAKPQPVTPSCLQIEFQVNIDDGGIGTWFAAVLVGLFLEVGNLEFQVSAQ